MTLFLLRLVHWSCTLSTCVTVIFFTCATYSECSTIQYLVLYIATKTLGIWVWSCSCTRYVYAYVSSVFLTMMLGFTDRVSHTGATTDHTSTVPVINLTPLKPIKWLRTKPGATEPFITSMHHVITMMTSKIIKFLL